MPPLMWEAEAGSPGELRGKRWRETEGGGKGGGGEGRGSPAGQGGGQRGMGEEGEGGGEGGGKRGERREEGERKKESKGEKRVRGEKENPLRIYGLEQGSAQTRLALRAPPHCTQPQGQRVSAPDGQPASCPQPQFSALGTGKLMRKGGLQSKDAQSALCPLPPNALTPLAFQVHTGVSLTHGILWAEDARPDSPASAFLA